MRDLIKKDLCAGFVFLLIIPIIIPFLTMMAIWAMVDDFGGMIVAFFTFLTMGLCLASSLLFFAIDAAPGAEVLFVSLPVKRSAIVYSRYCTSFLISLSALFIVLLTCLAADHIFGLYDPAFGLILSLRGMWSMSSALLIILSSLMPFIYKFGPEKGLVVFLFTSVGLGVILLIGDAVLTAHDGRLELNLGIFHAIFDALLKWVRGLKSTAVYFTSFAALILIVAISSLLSVRFYRRRDL
jgi:hypothetical protein